METAKEGTRRLRLDIDLTDRELEDLRGLCKMTHRSRKNLIEAMLKNAMGSFRSGSHFFHLMDLGKIDKTEFDENRKQKDKHTPAG